MSKHTEIRPATPADQPLIVRWNMALAAESEDKPLDESVLAPGVARVLSDATLGRYWIAERDGTAVGQIMVTYEWSDWRNGLFWWIQSVYVHADHRGSGVFKSLYQHVEKSARSDGGVCGLRLYVHDANTGAIETYRRIGMVDGQYRVMETVF